MQSEKKWLRSMEPVQKRARACWRPDSRIYFPDLTFEKSGVTSKGLNNDVRVGNLSALSCLVLEWLTCHTVPLGKSESEWWDFVRLSKHFRVPANWKIRCPWGESWHCEAVAPRHFGSMYNVLLIGLNETITALPLIAFVFYHESIDYQL